MLSDKDEDYKRHTLNYENARRTLEMELIKQQEELDILREKGVKFLIILSSVSNIIFAISRPLTMNSTENTSKWSRRNSYWKRKSGSTIKTVMASMF